jgi:predicted aspartyl protease
MLRVSMAIVAMFGATATAEAATVIPTVYEAGHFFATPTTKKGKTLRLVVDTGGGGISWTVVASMSKALGLSPASCQDEAGLKAPEWKPGEELPAIERFCGMLQATDEAPLPGGRLDGMLGGWYLASHTMTFDYPARRLVAEDDSWRPARSAHETAIGLAKNAHGELGSPFPRIGISVDGERVDLLLDTGATAHPSAAGRAAMRTPVVDGIAAASYITTNVMDGWRKKHPEWTVVDRGDDLFGAGKATRTIRVPRLTVAGWTIGPIWFTERPDRAFKGMSRYMDDEVHGALGGNALDAFRMTIDYAHGKAYFCEKACTPQATSARPVTF